ncbi:hypothetical protein [Leptospira stimsonii]|uniref:Uncharacterized protein n=1 Tax=Leptospira stimsonii TaxID=2202203 RepID=A0ABY2MV21_9LEPT|nr:hypothetical protein [Leptospira stimsonii]TGK25393.1 hypothetical protein EHO98_03060 [Leptospira stimsonii]TGM08812.1 hypothetical protein EHQ90_22245 [Leptospira stimsonii]
MPKIVRTVEFCEDAKNLIRGGYSKKETAKRLAKKYFGPEGKISYKTIRIALEEGPLSPKEPKL